MRKKERDLIIVQIVMLNYLNLIPNMKVVLVGLHSMSLYPTYLKQKPTIILVTQEQNIIAKIVVVITDIYLMTDLSLLEKGSGTGTVHATETPISRLLHRFICS